MNTVKGKSTGVIRYDKKHAQKKFVKFEREMFYGDFSGDNKKPTAEQIALKKKREEREALKESKRLEKRRRGSNTIKNRKAAMMENKVEFFE